MFYNRLLRWIVLNAITAAELYTSAERIHLPLVLVEDGHIVSIASQSSCPIPSNARHLAFPNAVLVPGFVDLHIHGSAGFDVMEASDSGLHRMAGFLATHGVTSFLATTVTAEPDALLVAVEKIAAQILRYSASSTARNVAARPIGIHLEGPCISLLRRGVHPAKYIKNPSLELFDRIHRAANGTLRLITLAPELPGAIEMIREAVRRGVKVSIGHTDGTAEDALAAIAAGATSPIPSMRCVRWSTEPRACWVKLSTIRS
jgi:N-acetylglucosamine-6-phosphate deacetylase